MIHFLEVSNQILFFYYLLSNLAYLMMLIIALKTSAAHLRRLESIPLHWIKGSPLAPPISVLVPAHNEEKSISTAVRNLLDLDYPQLEVIVINDGSADSTLQVMQQEFRLRLVRAVYVPQVTSAPVRGLYRSDVDARLLVVDKEPAGSKADAVNAGLNAATSPYVCVVDADSVLERDALLRIMVPVLADPKRVVSVGGIVRVLNGSEIEGGRMRRVRLPRKSIEVIQVVEYLRAFLIGREAWGRGNMLTIISGAFGVFRTDLVLAVGGHRVCPGPGVLDGSAIGPAIARETARSLAQGSAGCVVAEQGHALPAALWTYRMPGASLPVAVRISGPGHRIGWHRDHCIGSMLWRIERGILSAVSPLRVCVCNGDFHWFRSARGTDLQTIQRLAGCGSARQLLLPGTLSLPAIAYDLEIARPMAVLARRPGVETDETTGAASWRNSLKRVFQRPQVIALATRLLMNRGNYNRTRQRIAFLVFRHHAASGSCAMPSRSTIAGSRLGRTALLQSLCASRSLPRAVSRGHR
jgi:hypothetical protein